MHARLNLYRASERVPSRLSHRQRQLISHLTSILNATPHCASLSRPQLLAIEDGAELLAALDRRDYDALPPADAALARYVEKLTLRPGDVSVADIEALRSNGFASATPGPPAPTALA